MIGVNEKGDFIVDGSGHLVNAIRPDWQSIECECRCEQGTYFADQNFGRNPIVWKLSQSPNDRISDLTRIGNKYRTIQSCTFDGVSKYTLS